MQNRYVAYYRASTQKQNQSHLGLDAQRSTVMNYISHNGNIIVEEYTEIESGKNNQRPMLLKAIQKCKETDSTLCISRLDRLSRNLTFTSSLMDSKVKFICCDMPDANELTISIFASLAQWERKRISERTIDALNAKRAREPHWKPGTNNFTLEGTLKAHATVSNNARMDVNIRHCYHFIKPLREQGLSFARCATMLNDEGYHARLGGNFHGKQVFDIVKRFEGK